MPQRNVASNFTFEQQRGEINNLAQDYWTFQGSQTTLNSTWLKLDGSNAFTGGTLAVPNAFTINSNSGNGTVTISGNLNVSGTTTTVSSANLEVTDKNILIAKGSTSDANSDGAGITIDSATDITFNFVDAKDALVSSIGLEATTTLVAGGLASLQGARFAGTQTPSAGVGVEITQPDANTGNIQAYDRTNSAFKDLRLKGASVGFYAGSTNALVGAFHNTGLTMESGKTITGDLTGTASKVNLTSESSSTTAFRVPFTSANSGSVDLYADNSDGITYKPSDGRLSVQKLEGTIVTAAQGNITSVGTLTSLDISGGLDVDGTTDLDVTNVDGALTMMGGWNLAFQNGFNNKTSAIVNSGASGKSNLEFKVDDGNGLDKRLSILNTGTVRVNKGGGIGMSLVPANNTDTFQVQFDLADTTNKGYVNYDFNTDKMKFRAGGSGEILTLLNGSVGINSGSPTQAVLEVQGNTAYASSANSLATSVTNSAFRVKGSNNSSDSLWMGTETTDANPYIQGANDPGNNTKKLLLNPFGGNVGIGLVAPDTEFHVKGGGTVAKFEGTGGNAFLSLYDSDDSTQCFVGCDGGVFKIQTSGSSWSDKLSVNTDGQVNLGNSGTNQAQFCQSGSNHYIVGQAADNVAALEVYSQHGSSASKISFGVYDNRTGSKSASFLVLGNGTVKPGSDNAQDLGTSSARWANVYTGDMHLNNMNSGGNEVDGSEGHWTMQEGADDLFLINRNTGKKYKFNLTEVS